MAEPTAFSLHSRQVLVGADLVFWGLPGVLLTLSFLFGSRALPCLIGPLEFCAPGASWRLYVNQETGEHGHTSYAYSSVHMHVVLSNRLHMQTISSDMEWRISVRPSIQPFWGMTLCLWNWSQGYHRTFNECIMKGVCLYYKWRKREIVLHLSHLLVQSSRCPQ